MSTAIEFLFAALPVEDVGLSVLWYERLVGRAPDLVPDERTACWRLAESAWIYVTLDVDRAGTGMVTLLVDDLDAFIAQADEREVEMGAVESVGVAGRGVVLADLDGNRLQVAQADIGAAR
jgi:hypothetical protein